MKKIILIIIVVGLIACSCTTTKITSARDFELIKIENPEK